VLVTRHYTLGACGSKRPAPMEVQKTLLAFLFAAVLPLAISDRALGRFQADLTQRSIDANRKNNELMHVLYTVDSENDMDVALRASLYSVFKNAQDPGRLRFHFVVPQHREAQALCDSIMRVALNQRVQEDSPEGPASILALRNTVPNYLRRKLPFPCVTGRSSAEAECICSSLQFHVTILENDQELYQKLASQVTMLEEIAPHMPTPPGGGKSKAAISKKRLGNIANFSRNAAPEFLRKLNVDKVIYLDADTIVQADVADLWNKRFEEGKHVMISQDCTVGKKDEFNTESVLVQHIYKSAGQRHNCHFNSGVLVLDLVALEKFKLSSRIADVIKEHSRGPLRLWETGWQQPPFVLAVYNQIQALDREWNLARLGAGFCGSDKNGRFSEAVLRRAHILHWSGARKPWLPNGCFKEFWTPYSSPATTDRTRGGEPGLL